MKVYISADMEGISGLVAWSQCGRPDSNHYDFAHARARMTADVNAAIRGARAAGASEVVVKDSHGNSKNLLAHELEPGTRLISGCGSRSGGMMAGLDRSFGAAMLIGYHARAGTPNAIMEHTLTGFIHRMWVNDVEVGEIGLSVALAGCFDVPVVAISSDRAGCEEAAALLPGIAQAVVKEGYGRYVGDLMHPEDSAILIEQTARAGVSLASSLDPWLPDVPTTVRIEMNRTEETQAAMQIPGVRRLDGYTVEYAGDSWAEVHQAAWAIIHYAETGHSNG